MKRDEDKSYWRLRNVVIEVLITLVVALALYPVLQSYLTNV